MNATLATAATLQKQQIPSFAHVRDRNGFQVSAVWKGPWVQSSGTVWALLRDGGGVDLGQASLKVSLLSFALGVSGLKDTGSWHEVLNVLTQDLVLRLQLQILFLYSIDSGRQVWTRQQKHQSTIQECGNYMAGKLIHCSLKHHLYPRID